jgi:tRNA modification GTPase
MPLQASLAAVLDGSTICAIATPAGMGGIAVIRVSGPEAFAICSTRFSRDLTGAASHTVAFGRLFDASGDLLDECVATVFRGPASYTGEDTVEFGVHGSPFIQQEAVRSLLDAGCRHAGPGEFTARAFLNRKIDLTQAEAVGDLIAAEHSGAHKLALDQLRGGFATEINGLREQLIGFAGLLELELDFAEEDVEFADRARFDALLAELLGRVQGLVDSFRTGNAIREGVPVAILGAPNRGKSTLLNALLGDERAIVSEIAGTTRDTVEDTCILGGIKFRFVDTAGIRQTADAIEAEGIRRALHRARSAQTILYLFDASSDDATTAATSLSALEVSEDATVLQVWNKCDLSPAPVPASETVLHLSARGGAGLDDLRAALIRLATASTSTSALVVTNLRHYEALRSAGAALGAVRTGLASGLPTDLVASDVRQALHHLGTITGAIDPEDILDHIFANFCIGK